MIGSPALKILRPRGGDSGISVLEQLVVGRKPNPKGFLLTAVGAGKENGLTLDEGENRF